MASFPISCDPENLLVAAGRLVDRLPSKREGDRQALSHRFKGTFRPADRTDERPNKEKGLVYFQHIGLVCVLPCNRRTAALKTN